MNKENLLDFLICSTSILIIIVCLIMAVFTIGAFVKYSNTPITEIPKWAYWLMYGWQK